MAKLTSPTFTICGMKTIHPSRSRLLRTYESRSSNLGPGQRTHQLRILDGLIVACEAPLRSHCACLLRVALALRPLLQFRFRIAGRNTTHQKLKVFDCFIRVAVHLVIPAVLYFSEGICDPSAAKDILALLKFLGSVARSWVLCQDCNRVLVQALRYQPN